MRRTAYLALAALFIFGCQATITSFMDEASRAHIVRMRGNALAGGISRVELNAQRFEKGGSISYSLYILYSGPSFIGIEPGRSLVLLIDGARTEVSGGGSKDHRNTVSLGLVEEIAYYHDIDPEVIRRLSHAKTVDVEIQGSNKTMKRHFKKRNFDNFKMFSDACIEPVPTH